MPQVKNGSEIRSQVKQSGYCFPRDLVGGVGVGGETKFSLSFKGERKPHLLPHFPTTWAALHLNSRKKATTNAKESMLAVLTSRILGIFPKYSGSILISC